MTTFASNIIRPVCSRFDRSGNLYVLEDGTSPIFGKIYKITPSGDRTVFINTQSGGWDPQSFAFDSSGNVFVANNASTNAVRKFDSTGAPLGDFATLPAYIWELAYDKKSGNFFASSGNSIYRITFTGIVSPVGTTSSTMRGVAVDDAGNVFVSNDAGDVLKYTNGAGTPSPLTTGLVAPNHLGVDTARNVYVSVLTGSFNNGQAILYKISPVGSISTVVSAPRTSGGSDGFHGMDFEPSLGKSLNISTRLRVETGDNALIGGFIITGNAGKKVILRAIGPSLGTLGVQDALLDPTLQLYNSAGGLVNSNDDWKTTNQAGIQATGVAPSDDRESALVITLGTEPYTVVVRGKNNTSGVGLVEVYDLDQAANSRLANISTRGRIQTGENVMIGGFIIGGNGTRGIVRALGPSIAVSGALSDPVLSIRNGNGAEIASNDNWKTSQRTEIEATDVPPQNDLESAYVGYLPPGPNTVIVSGSQGGTGVGLVEFYNLQ
ncbi:MAG TPA: hypothetical protein VM940_02420 [Chthoniobacterales bacterium]|jgi:hypothetical protein|nr:hypothetical protein [Chthoniobacterales bacterium]